MTRLLRGPCEVSVASTWESLMQAWVWSIGSVHAHTEQRSAARLRSAPHGCGNIRSHRTS